MKQFICAGICLGFSANWAAEVPICGPEIRLCASERIELADRVSLKGSIVSPNVTIGNDDYIVGSLMAQNATVRDRAVFLGTIKTQFPIQNGNQTSISEAVLDTFVPPSNQAIVIQPGTVNIEVPNDVQQELAPGQYGDVVVRARSWLVVTSGEYSMRSLNVEPDAHLILNDCRDSVIALKVVQNVQFSDRSEIRNAANCSMSIQSTGDVRIGNDLELALDIVSTGAVQIGSRVSLQGTIASRSIKAEPDVDFSLIPVVRSTMNDSLLESSPSIWSRREFLQAMYLTTEPDQDLREAWGWTLAFANSINGRDLGIWKIPIMSVNIPYATMNGTQKVTRSLSITGTIEDHVYTPNILFLGMEDAQLVPGDALLGWDIHWDGQVVSVAINKSVQVPSGVDGTKIVKFVAKYQSGRTEETNFMIHVAKEQASY